MAKSNPSTGNTVAISVNTHIYAMVMELAGKERVHSEHLVLEYFHFLLYRLASFILVWISRVMSLLFNCVPFVTYL